MNSTWPFDDDNGFSSLLDDYVAPRVEKTHDALTVTEFINYCNSLFSSNYPEITIEGEVMNFKTNHGKYVFFDLKDETSSLGCFMWASQLNIPLKDGMKVVLRAKPELKPWGKFSLTVRRIVPVGEGNLKKAFELLKAKLEKEGLFASEKKRPLPDQIVNIGVISSPDAAGYADFIKILGARWGGLKLKVAPVKVQGIEAPDQIITALDFLNRTENLDVIAIIRGGGSADDLVAFNDETLTRAIAASRTPVITGIGHEIDTTLADLAADVRASTPSNVAELITPDRRAIIRRLRDLEASAKNTCLEKIHLTKQRAATTENLKPLITTKISQVESENRTAISNLCRELQSRLQRTGEKLLDQRKVIESFNPDLVLKQGYALISGNLSPGSVVKITTINKIITTEVKNVENR